MKKKLTVVLALVMLMLASAGAVYANASTDYAPPVTAQCCGCMEAGVPITPFNSWENGGGGQIGIWVPCCPSSCNCGQPPGVYVTCRCPRTFVPIW